MGKSNKKTRDYNISIVIVNKTYTEDNKNT